MAVEDAAVGQQDLEQADAAAVGRIGMANAHPLGRSNPLAARRLALRGARRRAGCVVLGRIGEDFELFAQIELGHVFDICSNSNAVESET
jgi:hypothetical protein